MKNLGLIMSRSHSAVDVYCCQPSSACRIVVPHCKAYQFGGAPAGYCLRFTIEPATHSLLLLAKKKSSATQRTRSARKRIHSASIHTANPPDSPRKSFDKSSVHARKPFPLPHALSRKSSGLSGSSIGPQPSSTTRHWRGKRESIARRR